MADSIKRTARESGEYPVQDRILHVILIKPMEPFDSAGQLLGAHHQDHYAKQNGR